MEQRQRVLLYGDTLVLAGVRACLEANPRIELIALDAAQATEQDLLSIRPDFIIFDTCSTWPQFCYDLIQHRPGMQLIGIDPDSNQVLVWSGQQMSELSMRDLVEVIQQQFRSNNDHPQEG